MQLLFKINGDGSGFTRAMNGVKGAAGKASGWIGDQFKGVGGTMLAAFSVGSLVAFGRGVIAMGAKVNDLSESYGISARSVQALSYAAEQSGTNVDALMNGMKKTALAMNDALGGDEEKLAAFERFGISIDDLKNKSPEEIFYMISDGMKNIQHTPQTFADIAAILGKSGTELIPAMTAGLREMAAEAERLGLIMDDAMVQKLADVDDQMAQLALRAQITFAPIVEVLADLFQGFFDFIAAGSDKMADVLGRVLAILGLISEGKFKAAIIETVALAKAVKPEQIVRDVAEGIGERGQERNEAAALRRIKKAREKGKPKGENEEDGEEKKADKIEKLRAQNEAAALKRQPQDVQITEANKRLLEAQNKLEEAKLMTVLRDTDLEQEQARAEILKAEGDLDALKKAGAKDLGAVEAIGGDALARIGGARGEASPLLDISQKQLNALAELVKEMQTSNRNTGVLNP